MIKLRTMQKLYCYVDETGQDTRGNIFVVSVVVTGSERDVLLKFCEETEEKSRKGKFKWGKAEPKRRRLQRTSKLRYGDYRGNCAGHLHNVQLVSFLF